MSMNLPYYLTTYMLSKYAGVVKYIVSKKTINKTKNIN